MNLTLGRNPLNLGESKGDRKTFQIGHQHDKIMEVWGREKELNGGMGFGCCFFFAVQEHHMESEFPDRGWNLFPL